MEKAVEEFRSRVTVQRNQVILEQASQSKTLSEIYKICKQLVRIKLAGELYFKIPTRNRKISMF